MRLVYAVLLAAVTLQASSNGLQTSEQAKELDTPLEASQWARSFNEEGMGPTGRSLRKREVDEEDEERTLGLEKVPSVLESVPSLSEKLPPLIKRFNNKFGRLSQYNVWIFTNKRPEWVKENFPRFFKSYEEFWENRMVRGGKYN